MLLQFLQHTASLPGGPGHWHSYNTMPYYLGAVGSATPTTHCLSALGQWAVQLLQYTASLSGDSGKCNSCNALPPCLGAVGSGTPGTHCLPASGQFPVQLLLYTSTLRGGIGGACFAEPSHTSLRQWTVELLQRTAALLGGRGRWNFCNTLPHCLGVVGSGKRSRRAWGGAAPKARAH